MVFIDNNEIKLTTNGPAEVHEDRDNKAKKIQFSSDDDINMILVYRSLYLLKRKFEVYEKEINKVYLKFKEADKMNLIIEKARFIDVVRGVFKECNFSFAEIGRPNELYRAELVSQINEDKLKIILDLFNSFMNENRDNYNEIVKKKKIKSFEKLNKFEEQQLDKEDSLIVEQKEEDMLEQNLDDDQKFDIHAKSVLHDAEEVGDKSQLLVEKAIDKSKDHPDQSVLSPEKMNTSQITEHVGPESKEVLADIENKLEEITPELIKENHIKKLEQKLDKELSTVIKELEIGKSDSSVKVTWSDGDVHKKSDFVLIEALPLIIADFISENQNIVLVDFNEDLRDELRTLFDNEILQRLGEEIKHDIDLEKEAKLKDLLFEKLNIENNIKTYENLLVEKGSKRENTIFIEKMLHNLREQKSLLSKKIKNLQDDNDTQNNHALLVQNESKVNITQVPKKRGKDDFYISSHC
jgi:hypothetical protein